MYNGFNTNRKGNPFGNVGVDMALEQTINAVAKKRLKAIMAYTAISTAVNGWITTNSMQSELFRSQKQLIQIKLLMVQKSYAKQE